MSVTYKIIGFMTVTTLFYLAVRNSAGLARVVTAAAGGISTVQKTAQGR